LAEDVYAYAPLRAGGQRIETPRYVVLLRLTPGPRSTLVTVCAPGRLSAGSARRSRKTSRRTSVRR